MFLLTMLITIKYKKILNETNSVFLPPIHSSMGSAQVGVQCLLTSSLGEFPGYWDWLWYPGRSPVLVSIAFPFAFHISMFSFCSPSSAIGFHLSIFHGGCSSRSLEESCCCTCNVPRGHAS